MKKFLAILTALMMPFASIAETIIESDELLIWMKTMSLI